MCSCASLPFGLFHAFCALNFDAPLPNERGLRKHVDKKVCNNCAREPVELCSTQLSVIVFFGILGQVNRQTIHCTVLIHCDESSVSYRSMTAMERPNFLKKLSIGILPTWREG